ncbi:MAG TPA: glycosyltransferase, partial [Flavobacteriaceae bacterium]|nr:glycosyltransferase [Flavobacteriaceae bacterium]
QFFKLNLLKGLPKMLKSIKGEKKALKSIIETYRIDGLISDNRLGIHSKNVPSVFITHQLQVLSGNTTWLSTTLHQNIINGFDECWVPDNQGAPNLSGDLGHVKTHNIPTKYIGPLSRFNKMDTKIKYNVLVLLSGPEPQRTMLEEKLSRAFAGYDGALLFIKGTVEDEQKRTKKGNTIVYNFMTSEQLEKVLNESELVVSRSGYTTIMDLAKLNKKAFFFPTPGQFEQVYLAKRLAEQGIAPSCQQEDFTLESLNKIHNYKGLSSFEVNTDFEELFGLFQSK